MLRLAVNKLRLFAKEGNIHDYQNMLKIQLESSFSKVLLPTARPLPRPIKYKLATPVPSIIKT